MGSADRYRRLLSLFLAAALVFSVFPAAGATEAAEEAVPLETTAEPHQDQTEPVQTVPSEIIPVVTDPAETEAPETQPEVLPSETEPTEIPATEEALLPSDTPSAPPMISAVPASPVLPSGSQVTLVSSVSEAVIYYSCSYDGSAYHPYVRYFDGVAVDDSAQVIQVKAYGVAPDGTEGPVTEFRFTREAQTVQSGSTASGSGQTVSDTGWNHYMGRLHAHSALSGGTQTVQSLFAEAKASGLDFLAVTDYSDSFLEGGELAAGTGTAEEFTAAGSFVAIYGFELSFPYRKQFGHIGTFATDLSYQQADFDTLESYYQALTGRPYSISQFNHPAVDPSDLETYGNFKNFACYNSKYDACIHLLEVVSPEGLEAYDQYHEALDQGWHVAPTNNLGRTVILAKSLTREALYEAIRAQRVYATQDSDLTIEYTMNGKSMGSILTERAATAVVTLSDPTSGSGRIVELLGDGGALIHRQTVTAANETLRFSLTDYSSDPQNFRYYYIQVREPDGSITAVTAPVWVELTEDLRTDTPSTDPAEHPDAPDASSPVAVKLTGFTADPQEPVPGQTVMLKLTIDSNQRDSLTIDQIRVNGTLDTTQSYPIEVLGLEEIPISIPYTYTGYGYTDIQVEITGSGFTLSETLTLFYMPEKLPVSSIKDLRLNGIQGEIYKIAGYITAGNSNAYTTFPNTLYLQDDTAGIEVHYEDGALEDSLSIGKAVELVGILGWQKENLVLELVQCALLPQYASRTEPQTLTASMAADLPRYGGTLVRAVGLVDELTYTNENRGISRFTLRDSSGNTVTVRIDDSILSGAYGVNQLSAQVITGRRVQAIGILHAEDGGTAVIRVRNCDEVTYAPVASASAARADSTNPRTGTYQAPFGEGIPTGVLLAVLCTSAAGLAALYRLRRKKR